MRLSNGLDLAHGCRRFAIPGEVVITAYRNAILKKFFHWFCFWLCFLHIFKYISITVKRRNSILSSFLSFKALVQQTRISCICVEATVVITTVPMFLFFYFWTFGGAGCSETSICVHQYFLG